MLVRKCDKCGKELNNDNEFNTVSLGGKEVDLCHECENELLSIIRVSYQSQSSKNNENSVTTEIKTETTSNSNSSTHSTTHSTTHKVTKTQVITKEEPKVGDKYTEEFKLNPIFKRQFEPKIEGKEDTLTKVTDSKVAKALKNDKVVVSNNLRKQVDEIVAYYKENAADEEIKREERRLKGKLTKMDKLHDYGIERFAVAYLSGTPSSYFEDLLGVTKYDVASFVRRYKIYKSNRSSKTSKEGDWSTQER